MACKMTMAEEFAQTEQGPAVERLRRLINGDRVRRGLLPLPTPTSKPPAPAKRPPKPPPVK